MSILRVVVFYLWFHRPDNMQVLILKKHTEISSITAKTKLQHPTFCSSTLDLH